MSTLIFHPNDPAFIHNPYPVYDQLRATAPIFYHEESQLWFCTAYEDVNTLLRDTRLGRSLDPIISLKERSRSPGPPEYEAFLKLERHSLFDKEPPDHTRLKLLVHKAFTPGRVKRLQSRIEAIAHQLINSVEASGRFDLLEDFAAPLAVTVIAELLGIPEEDRHRLRPWSHDMVAMYELGHTPEQAYRAIQAAAGYSNYLHHLARQRRATPQDDLITALALAEEIGDKLTEEELIANCVLLLNAGHEATVNTLGNGMWALLQHPVQFQALKSNLSLVNMAIEELMRYDTPLQLFRRWVLEDMAYKGIFFSQGSQIGLMFGAANRDPARFESPHTLDIRRTENPHLSFGAGIHYCLGAPLARLELQIAFTTLLKRLPDLRLVGETPEFRGTYVIRGLKALQLAF